jgi:hypothetical protein
MRSRASLAFTGALVIALIAVMGFAAFSARGTDPAALQAAGEDVADEPVIPRSVSGRILGAVVAAALTPEPAEPESADLESAEVSAAIEDEADLPPPPPPTVAATAAPSTTTTTRAPQPKGATANVTPPATTPPEIVVTSPKDGATVDDKVIEFRGETEPGARVASGSFEASVDEDGSWSIRLVLREGRNRAYFTATDDVGNSQTISLSVTYDPPAATTTTTTTTTTKPPPDNGGPRNVEEWRPLVSEYFPAELVDDALSVIYCESKGDPSAYNSRSGASGLFQFIERTWNWASSNAGWAGASPFDPEANVASAAWLVDRSISRGQDAWHHWSCKP